MDYDTDFPASENTPGQLESRTALATLEDIGVKFNWWAAFDNLRAARKYHNWRVAAFVAWSSAPIEGRLPATQKQFARLIGLKSAQTIRKWRAKYPDIDHDIMALRTAAIFEHTADVLAALVSQAKRDDYKSHNDRKLFLEIVGIKGDTVQMSGEGPATKGYTVVSPSDWDNDTLDNERG